jgi:hypothetical protein
MSESAAIVVLLCLLVVAIVVGTFFNAVFLRAACAFYNKLAGGKGSPSSVPEPRLGKAMGIIFVTALVNAVVAFAIGLLVVPGSTTAGANTSSAAIAAQLLPLPVSLLVMASMNAAWLPTTFARGLLVALCYLLVVLFVVVVLLAIFGGLYLVFPIRR